MYVVPRERACEGVAHASDGMGPSGGAAGVEDGATVGSGRDSSLATTRARVTNGFLRDHRSVVSLSTKAGAGDAAGGDPAEEESDAGERNAVRSAAEEGVLCDGRGRRVRGVVRRVRP